MFEKLKRFWQRRELAYEQHKINRKYDAEGLTDEVLDAQVALNQKRNQLDISDEKNRIYENFVQ